MTEEDHQYTMDSMRVRLRKFDRNASLERYLTLLLFDESLFRKANWNMLLNNYLHSFFVSLVSTSKYMVLISCFIVSLHIFIYIASSRQQRSNLFNSNNKKLSISGTL